MRVHPVTMAFVLGAALVLTWGCKESDTDEDAGPLCDPVECEIGCQALWTLTGRCVDDQCLCFWPEDAATDTEMDTEPADAVDDASDVPVEMPVDACTGSGDQAIIDSTDVYGEAAGCAMSCLSAPDMAVCVQPCLVDATGLGDDCALCYGAAVQCSFENCLSSCSTDPEGAECQACIEESGCQAGFETCSGITE